MKANPALPNPLLARGRSAEVYAWGSDCVCKLFYESCTPTCADQEARLLRAVRQARLPVPEVLDIVDVQGRRGILMERVDGQSMWTTAQDRPWRGVALAQQLAELHALVHGCAAPDFPSQRHQLEHAISHAPDLSNRQRAAALQALARRLEGMVLCHGNFHPAHVLFAATGPVIVDWLTASQGEPHADAARTALLLRHGDLTPGRPSRPMPGGLRQILSLVYLRRYRTLAHASSGEILGWELPIVAARLREGIPAERQPLLERLQALVRQN